MANVESQEWKLPILYLYRRQLPDSGGAGRWRGGLTSEAALTPHGVPRLVLNSTNTAGTEASNAHGIDGGYPGAGSQVRVLRDTTVWKQIPAGSVPRDDRACGGTVEHLPSKASDSLAKGDVLVFFAAGGGGFGDPLDREPERVANDVANGWVTQEHAREMYGVIMDTGRVDADATIARRDAVRGTRKQRPLMSWKAEDCCQHPAVADGRSWRVGENVELDTDGVLRCRHCCHAMTGPQGNVAMTQRPLRAANPWMALRRGGDSPHFVLEELSCPHCATLISVREVRREPEAGNAG
jgi:N-methylhydantoinase B